MKYREIPVLDRLILEVIDLRLAIAPVSERPALLTRRASELARITSNAGVDGTWLIDEPNGRFSQ